jgi:serine/threonine protein kinase
MKPTPKEIKKIKDEISLDVDNIKRIAEERQHDNNLMIQQYLNLNQISDNCVKANRDILSFKWGPLKKAMNSQFYNFKMMNDFFCHNNLRLHYWSPTLAQDQRYHRYISLLRQLYKGNYGQTWSGYVREIKDFFVIKTALKGSEFEDMRREAFVGFHMNEMRKMVPNFVMTFGYFELPIPIEITKNFDTFGIIGWDDKTKSEYSPYIVQEMINKSVSLKSVIKDISILKDIDTQFKVPKTTVEEIKFIWGTVIQTLCAIVVAHRRLDFTHYDLHNENVLLRNGVRNSSIRYELGDGIEVFLPGDHVSVIIDYGLSHIKVDRRDIGYPGFQEYFISDNTSSLVCDCYRIVMFVLKDLQKKYPLYVSSEGQQIYNLFGDVRTNVNDVIEKEMKETLFFIPNDKTFNVIDFIFNLCSITKYQDLTLIQKKETKLLDCDSYRCDKLTDFKDDNISEYDDLLMGVMSGSIDIEHIKNKSFIDKQDNDLDKIIKNIDELVNKSPMKKEAIYAVLNFINDNISLLEIHQMIKELIGEDNKVISYIDTTIKKSMKAKTTLIDRLKNVI